MLEVIARIPTGRVTTYGTIGEELGVPARHVAYVLAVDADVHALPWHRVVGAKGVVKQGSHHDEQVRRLRSEGVSVVGDRVTDFATRRIQVSLDEHDHLDPPASR